MAGRFACALAFAALAPAGCAGDEGYTEALVLRALPEGRVHATYNLTVTAVADAGRGYDGFPKVVGELARYTKLSHLQMSLVRGVWRPAWGGMAVPAPASTTLMASFEAGEAAKPKAWGVVANTLAGLSCASLNFFAEDDPSLPIYARAEVLRGHRDGWDFWGTLPSEESVCTENLAPLLSLFPHRGKAGLSKLLQPQEFFRASFHAIALQYARSASGDGHTLSLVAEAVFEADANAVDNAGDPLGFPVILPDAARCPLCTHASRYDVRLVADRDGVDAGALIADVSPEPAGHTLSATVTSDAVGRWFTVAFDGDGAPNVAVGFTAAFFDEAPPATARPATSVEYVSLDSGDDVGTLVVEVLPQAGAAAVDVQLLLPLLLIQPYVSTLQVLHEGRGWVPTAGRVAHARAQKLLVLTVAVPVDAAASRVLLRLRYDKKILPLDAYPPDANRMYLLPPVAVWSTHASGGVRGPVYNPAHAGITLGTPDFSMPFNAITLTCTSFAMIFGTAFRHATGDYEREPQVAAERG